MILININIKTISTIYTYLLRPKYFPTLRELIITTTSKVSRETSVRMSPYAFEDATITQTEGYILCLMSVLQLLLLMTQHHVLCSCQVLLR